MSVALLEAFRDFFIFITGVYGFSRSNEQSQASRVSLGYSSKCVLIKRLRPPMTLLPCAPGSYTLNVCRSGQDSSAPGNEVNRTYSGDRHYEHTHHAAAGR